MPLSVDLLKHTETSLESAESEVDFRRCISSAYYAAWHAVCESIADKFAPELKPLLCRCPAHDKVKVCAGSLRSRKSPWFPNHELSPDMDSFCVQFIQLQKDRHNADYSLVNTFSQQDARQAFIYSKSIVSDLIPKLISTCEYDAFVLGCIGLKPAVRD